MPKNITIAVTNDASLADPASLIYSVSPPPLHEGDIVGTLIDSSPLLNDGLKIGSPIFKENIVGGWPVVRLGAVGDGFNLKNAISGASDWTLIAVMKPINPVGVISFVMASDLDNGPYAYYFDGGNPPTVSSASRAISSTSRTYNLDAVWTVWVVVFSATAGYISCYANGGGLDNYGMNPVAYTGDFNNIGGRGFDNLFPANLDLAELLFCGQALSDPTVKDATQTLSSKYRLNLSVGTVIDLATLPALKGWWKADALSAPFDPNKVAQLQARWEVDSITQPDGPLLTPWHDQSGNNRDATPITAPAFYNGIDSVSADLYYPTAANAYLSFPAIDITAGWTLFAVIYTAANANTKILSANSGTPSPEGIDIDGPNLYLADAGVRWLGQLATERWTLISVVSDYAASFHFKCWQNGNPVALSNGGGWAGPMPQFDLIGLRGDGSPCNNAHMRAILCYRGVMSDADRIYIENGLKVKYRV